MSKSAFKTAEQHQAEKAKQKARMAGRNYYVLNAAELGNKGKSKKTGVISKRIRKILEERKITLKLIVTVAEEIDSSDAERDANYTGEI